MLEKDELGAETKASKQWKKLFGGGGGWKQNKAQKRGLEKDWINCLLFSKIS